MSDNTSPEEPTDILTEVDRLSAEVKGLSVDLALMLSKIKTKDGGKVDHLEPDFIRLINGSVQVIREISIILGAAQNNETMVYDVPSGKFTKDRIETKLHGILEQTNRVLESLAELRDIVV